MWQNEADDNQQAIDLCHDLANGESPEPYIVGTMRKSPQLTPLEARQVVSDAIGAYCPQYLNRCRRHSGVGSPRRAAYPPLPAPFSCCGQYALAAIAMNLAAPEMVNPGFCSVTCLTTSMPA